MMLSSPAFTKPSQTRFSESWGAQHHQTRSLPLLLTKSALKPAVLLVVLYVLQFE